MVDQKLNGEEKLILIEHIRQHPIIWQVQPLQRNRNGVNNAFQQICKDMAAQTGNKYTVDLLRTGWRILCIYFRKLIKDFVDRKSSGSEEAQKAWRFYIPMQFMVPVIRAEMGGSDGRESGGSRKRGRGEGKRRSSSRLNDEANKSQLSIIMEKEDGAETPTLEKIDMDGNDVGLEEGQHQATSVEAAENLMRQLGMDQERNQISSLLLNAYTSSMAFMNPFIESSEDSDSQPHHSKMPNGPLFTSTPSKGITDDWPHAYQLGDIEGNNGNLIGESSHIKKRRLVRSKMEKGEQMANEADLNENQQEQPEGEMGVSVPNLPASDLSSSSYFFGMQVAAAHQKLVENGQAQLALDFQEAVMSTMFAFERRALNAEQIYEENGIESGKGRQS